MNIAANFEQRSKTEPISAASLYRAGASWNRDIQAYVFPDNSAGFFANKPRFSEDADGKRASGYYMFEALPGTHQPQASTIAQDGPKFDAPLREEEAVAVDFQELPTRVQS